MKSLFSIIFFLITNTLLYAQREDGAVISGDFADPSIIKVGKKFFAVGTSSELAPHFPIYESSDLKNGLSEVMFLIKRQNGQPDHFGLLNILKLGRHTTSTTVHAENLITYVLLALLHLPILIKVSKIMVLSWNMERKQLILLFLKT